jgi:hypothetical protein
MELNERLIILRKNIRSGHKRITDSIISLDKKDICIFCGTRNNLTKEHVMPKWAYGNNPGKYFTTTLNGINQEYNKTTVPACLVCNSNILSSIEKEIVAKLFKRNDKINYFSDKDKEHIILWLEIIDYKFQVLNLRRKFIRTDNGTYIPYLANMPISILQDNASLTPAQVFSKLRKAQRRLGIKSKCNLLNSLILFKTKNTSFHFFHKTSDFIFLELANLGYALFYFYDREYKREIEAYKAAMKIIKKIY